MATQNVAAPLRDSGKIVPELILLTSPYRFVLAPLVDHILKLERDNPARQIAALVPELVVKHWWQTPLHNQRAQLLKLLLLARGNMRIIVINISWYLQSLPIWKPASTSITLGSTTKHKSRRLWLARQRYRM